MNATHGSLRWVALIAVLVSAGAAIYFALPQKHQSAVSFSKDIRPILNENCTACHGGVKKQNGVSFIYRQEALAVGKSGLQTIVPGDPDASELIVRVSSSDANFRMPYNKPPLLPEQIELLRQWIEEGAEWEEHWSFVAPRPVNVPTVMRTGWVRSPIDSFVLARLESEGLEPQTEAKKTSLLRRVSLDLTGLSPTPAEIDLFIADTEDGAYERQVDRLLGSPHFGERWATLWLDLARYADTRGYEADIERTVWPYRDWLIDALNNNVPFDEFVITQIAGDLLPDAALADHVATIFHRLTPSNDEGGSDDEEYRMIAAMDRSTTTWQVLNGLTMQCVQCHSHPYDPIRHEEFYNSLAFFNTARDADLSTDLSPMLFIAQDESQQETTFDLQMQLQDQASQLTESGRVIARHSTWIGLPVAEAFYDPIAGMEWRLSRLEMGYENDEGPNSKENLAAPLAKARASAEPNVHLRIRDDGAFAEQEIPTISVLKLRLDAPLSIMSALRIEVMPFDETMARHSPEEGFIVEKVDAWLVHRDGQREKIEFAYFAPDSDENLRYFTYTAVKRKSVLSGNDELKFDPLERYPTTGAFAANSKLFHTRWTIGLPLKSVDIPPGSQLEVHLAMTETVGEEGITPAPVRRVRISASADGAWTVFANDPARKAQVEKIVALEDQLSIIPTDDVPVMREREANIQRETRRFERGNLLAKTGGVLNPATPTVFPPIGLDAPRNRLALARWFFTADQPLTARVTVNRYWQQLFGTGIVETLEDFGSAGMLPEHPDLLDWLARHFQHELKWDIKALLREIVCSATYRQSAKSTLVSLEADPDNRLLARGPQQRLTAEMVRDQALLASGLLTRTLGGPPVMPPQPQGVGRSVYNDFTWEDAKGPDRYRRAVYTYIKRSSIYPSFVTFDLASRDVSHPRRSSTNTPLQALVTLNDPIYVEAAKVLAQTVSEEGASIEEHIELATIRVLSRPPTANEQASLIALYEDALDLVADEEAETAALAIVASALLNLDAAMTR